MNAIFNKFDTQGKGKLDYEEFCSYFAKKGSGNNPNVNPVFGIKREPPNQVLQKIWRTLKERGMYGIRALGQVLRKIDHSQDKKIDRYQFQWALKENGHTLAPSEFERIFKYYDKNNEGKISYNDFLQNVRGNMNEKRMQLLHMIFKKIDKQNSGVVSLEDLVA